MTKRLYLDSDVFISFVREEIDSSLNLRYLESGNFFAFCAKQGHILLISKWFLEEVKRIIFLNAEAVSEEFGELGVNTNFVDKKISEILVSKIAKENCLHTADAAHVVTAIENKADFIITWNTKDFGKTKHLVKRASPIEILEIL